MTSPHDPPDARALVEAVRQFLVEGIEPELDGNLRYYTKVAANLLAIVERELRLGPEQATRHAERLERLGYEDDAALSAAIRSGSEDDRLDALLSELREAIRDKLAVARPKHAAEVRRRLSS